MGLWNVLPDSERQQWTLDPFVGVGPLRFGMTTEETTAALDGSSATGRRHSPQWNIWCHALPDLGLGLYFASEGLRAISIGALRGPQVVAEGTALVGRTPSEMEQWMFERADSREPRTELFYLPSGDPGSLTLGVALCTQRAGDRLLTRPVFLPADAMDDVYHQLPREAWAIT